MTFVPPEVDPAPGVSAVQAIRAHTREMHVRLESQVDLARCLSSRAEYGRMLERYLSVYAPLEAAFAALSAAPQAFLHEHYTSHAQHLRQDLQALGATEERTAQESPAMPPLETLDELLGTLYVVEGSMLGGQILYRQIQERLGLDRTQGASFFYGAGEATGSHWKRFLAALEQNVTDTGAAVAAACAMFLTFERALVPGAVEA